MSSLDTRSNREDDERADFSNVRSGASSTAPDAQVGRPITTESGRKYTVVAGDSLSKIAKQEYGDAGEWHRIYEANKDVIKNPDVIYPGQELTIPQR
ncbi:MAG: LysM peptidoglycan-binding domain-containing protein [Gemmatimonadota bacterium]